MHVNVKKSGSWSILHTNKLRNKHQEVKWAVVSLEAVLWFVNPTEESPRGVYFNHLIFWAVWMSDLWEVSEGVTSRSGISSCWFHPVSVCCYADASKRFGVEVLGGVVEASVVSVFSPVWFLMMVSWFDSAECHCSRQIICSAAASSLHQHSWTTFKHFSAACGVSCSSQVSAKWWK